MGKIEIEEHILSEPCTLLEEQIDCPFSQGQSHRIKVQDLPKFFVSGHRDAFDLVALQLPEFSDTGTVFLLEKRIVDAAREDLHVDDGTAHSRRDPQGRILHVLGFLSEDRGE